VSYEVEEPRHRYHRNEPPTLFHHEPRAIDGSLATILKADYNDLTEELSLTAEELTFNTQADLDTYIAKLETEMRDSAIAHVILSAA